MVRLYLLPVNSYYILSDTRNVSRRNFQLREGFALLDMLVNYFAINLFSFGRFRNDPIFTINCIRYVNIFFYIIYALFLV
jgi:hypothetical protein